MNAAAERLHLFGIRHHGPGSARSLLTALTALVDHRYADWDREVWRIATAVQSFLASSRS